MDETLVGQTAAPKRLLDLSEDFRQLRETPGERGAVR